ncbi:MAG: zinc ABC transporter substrate-binding protein [Gemmobacter sp.]
MRYTISYSRARCLAAAAMVAALPGLARAEVPRVVTDIPPVHSLVAQVMGELGAPVLLLDRGADAHDFQLRPSQMQALSGAGLVVWAGPGMTPWLARVIDTAGVGSSLALLEAEGTHLQDFGAGADDHDHGDDHGHDHGQKAEATGHAHDHGEKAAEAAHDHDHSGTDPHAWLDPHNAEGWLGLIAAELSRLDPANAATYSANAAAAAEAVEALEDEITAMLAPVKDRPFVTFHDAYGYFTGHFGLRQVGSITLGDAASPGAQRLSALRAELAGQSALCVFPEANHDARLAVQLTDATGTKLGPVLDPEGSGFEPGPALYGDLLRGLAQGLVDCLGDS